MPPAGPPAFCRRALVLSLAATLTVAGGRAATGQEPATVRGVVVSSAGDGPVPRATIAVRETARTVVTDDRGRFAIVGLPSPSASLRVRALGYRPREVAVASRPGQTVEIVVRLDAAPATLGAVRTTARASDRERFEAEPTSGIVSIRAADLEAVPAAAEADVLRAVQALPGVAARSDFTAAYNVRGGESDQNLVLLDGIPIYNPFHLGGLFGMFLDETIGEAALHTGVFPVVYGGRLASVLDVRSAAEDRTGVHGQAGVSLLAASLALGGALGSGVASWNVGLRRTYADALARLVGAEAIPYHFDDLHANARYLLPGGGTLSVTGYAGRDELDGALGALGDSIEVGSGDFALNVAAGDYRLGWGNFLVGVTLQQPLGGEAGIPIGPGRRWRFGDSAWVVQRVAVSTYRTTLDLGAGGLTYDNRVLEQRLQGALTWHRGGHAPTAGYEVSRHAIDYASRAEQLELPLAAVTQRPVALALHADDRWQPHPRLAIRWGLRAEHLNGTSWWGLSPRASARVFVARDVALTGGVGRFTQLVHGLRAEDVGLRMFDFWIGSEREIAPAYADGASAGVEAWLGPRRLVRAEGWAKRFHRLHEPSPDDDRGVRGDELREVRGEAYGADVLLRQLGGGRASGWLAYSYLVSVRSRDGGRYAPAQDRRHTANLVATLRAPWRVQVAARAGYGSGAPYTGVSGQARRRYYDPSSQTWVVGGEGDLGAVPAARNSSRYPPFHRLDLSASRRFAWGSRVVVPSVSVVNVYNRRNVFAYEFDYSRRPPTRQTITQFPALPTVGVQVEF